MKSTFSIYRLCFVLCALCPSMGHAQTAITIDELDQMNFGTIIVDPNGDEIRIRPNGRMTSTGQSFFSGTTSGARFRLRGEPNAAFNISFSSGDVLTGSGAAISLEQFQHNRGDTPAFNGNGRRNTRVGARLVINAGQISGAYSGTYTIFVDYP